MNFGEYLYHQINIHFKNMNKLLLPLAIAAVFTACVPARKYQELEAKSKQCEEELADLKQKSLTFEAQLAEQKSELDRFKKEYDFIKRDKEMLESSLRLKEGEYDKLNHLYLEVEKKYEKLIAGSESEYKLVREQLERTRIELQRKEDLLKQLEQDLNAKEAKLNQLSVDLETRSQRVKELENIIAQQDAVVRELKDKISKALLAFKDKGITVEERNGKVYVSLDAKLLFASGSTKVDFEGKQALIDLAKILENEKELEVVVEGHTDTDAIRSTSTPKNNWELSVLRATAVVEIMLANSKMDPKILSAAGRGEYLPIDPNDKAKNRRIEIILTPKLDELYKIISK
jgi:chemotaxis protein MotB